MKKLVGIILSVSLLFFFALPAFAQESTSGAVELCPTDTGSGDSASGFNALCFLTPQTAIPTLITFIMVLAIIIALFYLVWGGIKWITSGGDKGNVEGARNQIIAAVIGLIVIFLAWFIISLVLQVFLGRGASGTFELPTIGGAAQGGGAVNRCPEDRKPACGTRGAVCTNSGWSCQR